MKATHTDGNYGDMEVVAWQNETEETMSFVDGIWGPFFVEPGHWCIRDKGGFPLRVSNEEFQTRFTEIRDG